MGFSKPLIGSVADSGNVLVPAVLSGLYANWRMSTSLQVIGKRGAARSIEQCLQMRVATNAGSEAVAIGLSKGVDAGIASFLTNLPIAIAFAIVEAGPRIFSFLAFFAGKSGSFLWHATLISNSSSSEREPHSQLGTGFDLRQQSSLVVTTSECPQPRASTHNGRSSNIIWVETMMPCLTAL
jgi:hypothetical protein